MPRSSINKRGYEKTDVIEVLNRRDVVSHVLSDSDDLLVISGLGSPSWDVTYTGDKPTFFPLWGAMGGAAMVALGLAMAQPRKRVVCVTGDGEMLMSLGALATISVEEPTNLTILVLDNEHYGETGMQKTHTGQGVNLDAMARGAGFKTSSTVTESSELPGLRETVYRTQGPNFVVVKVDPKMPPVVLPPREGSYLKNRFRQAVLGPDAVYDR